MSSVPVLRRACATLTISTITAMALLIPTAAPASELSACTVTDAQLTWGFKESFRSYISGSIAKGTWEVIDGATYETPSFGWSSDSGSYDPEAATGQVAFAGGIHFTGHGGLLDTTVTAPTLVFTGDDSAQLLLDVSGVAMESALAGDDTVESVEQVPFVDIDLSGAEIAAADGVLTVTADQAATAITADGFAAFGSYEEGTAFDPITIALTATCAAETPTPTATAQAPVGTADAADVGELDDAGAMIVPLVLGTLLVIVAGGVTISVVLTRRKRAARATSGDQQ